MNKLITVVNKAQTSKFYLWVLNVALHRAIPYNKPHNLKIVSLTNDSVKMLMPYQKNNLNHIQGLHACGLATVCEYAAGFSLIRKIDFKKYRLILEKLEVTYNFQGKSDGYVEFGLTDQYIKENIIEKLQLDEKISVKLATQVKDAQGNILCDTITIWQLKEWSKVKTKISK